MKICMKILKNSDLNSVLENEPFNENEIIGVLSNLKSGKAAGLDCLLNVQVVSPVYC